MSDAAQVPHYQLAHDKLPPWGDAAAADDFWEGVPAVEFADVVSGEAPSQATLLRGAWHGGELRFRFEATDTDPWATLTERDAPLYTEETVELFLDPVGDLASYFEIEVNPLNTVLDLVLRRTRAGLAKDRRWRCEGLRTAVTRTALGWVTDVSIPIASLTPDRPVVGMKWRANFTRIDRPRGRERELTAWSPTWRANFHEAENFGVIEFVD